MRLTIIADDKTVIIDGIKFSNIDLSSLPENVHAVQWYDDHGEIEFKGNVPNQDITNIDAYQEIINAWNVRKYLVDNPPPPPDEIILNSVKFEVDMLLIGSDWAVLPDVPLANKDEWILYRQNLRDIRTNLTVDPVWPTKPEVIWEAS
jgi:hypothetical protein